MNDTCSCVSRENNHLPANKSMETELHCTEINKKNTIQWASDINNSNYVLFIILHPCFNRSPLYQSWLPLLLLLLLQTIEKYKGNIIIIMFINNVLQQYCSLRELIIIIK